MPIDPSIITTDLSKIPTLAITGDVRRRLLEGVEQLQAFAREAYIADRAASRGGRVAGNAHFVSSVALVLGIMRLHGELPEVDGRMLDSFVCLLLDGTLPHAVAAKQVAAVALLGTIVANYLELRRSLPVSPGGTPQVLDGLVH